MKMQSKKRVRRYNTELDEIDKRNALNRFDTIDSQRLYKRRRRDLSDTFSPSNLNRVSLVPTSSRAVDILRTKISRSRFHIHVCQGRRDVRKLCHQGEDYSMGGVLQSTVDNADKLVF
jgi:hypothetical protein